HGRLAARSDGYDDAGEAALPAHLPDDPDADPDGDGLTNFEEWRGFIVGGGASGRVHVRTDSSKPDVFVRDRDATGIGHFAQVGVTVHVLQDPDLYASDDTRVVNFNRGSHSRGDQ